MAVGRRGEDQTHSADLAQSKGSPVDVMLFTMSLPGKKQELVQNTEGWMALSNSTLFEMCFISKKHLTTSSNRHV